MIREYEIHWNSDYRGNSNITLYEYRETPKYDENAEMIGYDFSYVNDKPENFSVECGYISIPPVSDVLDLASKIEFRVFCYSNEKLLLLKEFNNKEDANLYCLEVHKELNGCSPFQVTGYTCSYKEMGHYVFSSSVNDNVRANLNDFSIETSKLPVFCLIAKNNGGVLDILSIRPFS